MCRAYNFSASSVYISEEKDRMDFSEEVKRIKELERMLKLAKPGTEEYKELYIKTQEMGRNTFDKFYNKYAR